MRREAPEESTRVWTLVSLSANIRGRHQEEEGGRDSREKGEARIGEMDECYGTYSSTNSAVTAEVQVGKILAKRLTLICVMGAAKRHPITLSISGVMRKSRLSRFLTRQCGTNFFLEIVLNYKTRLMRQMVLLFVLLLACLRLRTL